MNRNYFYGLVYNEKGMVDLGENRSVRIYMGPGEEDLDPIAPGGPYDTKGGSYFVNVCNPGGLTNAPYGWGYGGDLETIHLASGWVNYGEVACDEDGGNGSDFAAEYQIKVTGVWTSGAGTFDSSNDPFNVWLTMDQFRKFYMIPNGNEAVAQMTVTIRETLVPSNSGDVIITLIFEYSGLPI